MGRLLNCQVANPAIIDHEVDEISSHSIEQLLNHSHKLFDSMQTSSNTRVRINPGYSVS